MIVKRPQFPHHQLDHLFAKKPVKQTDHKKPLKLISGGFYRPKENALNPFGEDAHFICHKKNIFGLADGVGSWAREGIDAGKYARLLMKNSETALVNEPKEAVDPKRVLQEAYSNTNVKGSSTACIVTLKSDKKSLRVVNVGDSGFFLFRNRECIYQSPLQQHKFNYPFQLGKSNDDPSVADEIQICVEAGDIVVAGTDGLLDNIYPKEIEEILCEIKGYVCPEQLAWTILETAVCNSQNLDYRSPFQVAAGLCGYRHIGGKVDDITVVVGLIEV